MNWSSLFAHLPAAVIVGWVAAVGIPYVSALLTKFPGWWTGALTLILSAVDGFLAEWVHAGDAFQWKAALGPFALAYLTAAVTHTKILSGTDVEATLHNRLGVRPVHAGAPQ